MCRLPCCGHLPSNVSGVHCILYFIFQEQQKYLLRHVSHEEFKSVILPAIDRSMLRNPEIILQGTLTKSAAYSFELLVMSLMQWLAISL